jgi:hypothetical protein
MGEPSEVKLERRRGDNLVHLVSALFMIILSGLTWWMSKIDSKADKVPILEERVMNLQMSINKIENGVEKLLQRKQ